MSAKIAVAVIHGIGSQANKTPQVSDKRTFSAGLYKKLRGVLGGRVMARDVAWREIFWADILQWRQNFYLEQIEDQVSMGPFNARRLLVSNFADALAFSRRGTAYEDLQLRIKQTIRDLRGDCGAETPLLIFAHSFGGRIMSNYIWDLQNEEDRRLDDPFENMQTVARFVTFGCNLPLFTFSYPVEEVAPFAFPGAALPDQLFDEPWWTNYFDRQDLLAYPIAPIGPRYRALEERGELADIPVNVGGLTRRWNTLSHDEYWTSGGFYKPVGAMMKRLLAKS